jgi:hypothetical protein
MNTPNEHVCTPLALSEEKRRAADHTLSISHIIWTIIRPRLIEIDPPQPVKNASSQCICKFGPPPIFILPSPGHYPPWPKELARGIQLWSTIDTASVGNALFPLTVLAAKSLFDIHKGPLSLAWAMTGGLVSPTALWLRTHRPVCKKPNAYQNAYWFSVYFTLPHAMSEMCPFLLGTKYSCSEIIKAMFGIVGPNWRETIDLLLQHVPTLSGIHLMQSDFIIPAQVSREEIIKRVVSYYIKKITTRNNYNVVQYFISTLLDNFIHRDQAEHIIWLLNEFDVPLYTVFLSLNKIYRNLARSSLHVENRHASTSAIMNWVKGKADPREPLSIYGCLLWRFYRHINEKDFPVAKQLLLDLFGKGDLLPLLKVTQHDPRLVPSTMTEIARVDEDTISASAEFEEYIFSQIKTVMELQHISI